MRTLTSAAAALILSLGAGHAATILTFGQSGGGDTITAAAGAAGTTFVGTAVPVTITQIDAGVATPVAAFFDVTATSTAAGAVTVGPAIVEHFSGSFAINASAAFTGVNYLSGTFSDAAITASGSTAVAVFAPTAGFSSDVITTLALPRSLSIALTDVGPAVSLVAAPLTTSGETLAGFTSAIAGNASAAVVPEPASLALLAVGVLGLAAASRRRAARR